MRITVLVALVVVLACSKGGRASDPGHDARPDIAVVPPDIAYDVDGAKDAVIDPGGGDEAVHTGPDLVEAMAEVSLEEGLPDPGKEDPGTEGTADPVAQDDGADLAPEAKAEVPPQPECGDQICDLLYENCATCPKDCSKCPEDPCGNWECEVQKGETCATCPKDCGPCPACPDGKCSSPQEDCHSCPQDCGPCPPACPDGQCNGDETCSSCPQDCGPCKPVCPDGHCNGDETCLSCPQDCGACPPSCGDGVCSGAETCDACPQDCGACSPTCGDGKCDFPEVCQSCPADCGACPPTITFTADWKELLDGPIVAGRKLRIRYDLDRLTQCRQTHNGYPGWTIKVFYTFDLSKPASEVQVVMHNMGAEPPFVGTSVPVEPIIEIPEDAHDVWFWANNTGVEGCIAWDSDYGKNYMFPVFTPQELAQPVQWAGWGSGAIDFQYINEGGTISKGDADPVWFFHSMLGGELTTAVMVQVYAAGITDRVYQNADVATQVGRTAIAVSTLTNFAKGAGAPSADPVMVPIEFQYQAQNNFFYRWYFGSFTYFMEHNPFPEGLYSYRLVIKRAEGEPLYIGKTGDSSKPRGLVYAEDSSTGCKLFPGEPPQGVCN